MSYKYIRENSIFKLLIFTTAYLLCALSDLWYYNNIAIQTHSLDTWRLFGRWCQRVAGCGWLAQVAAVGWPRVANCGFVKS